MDKVEKRMRRIEAVARWSRMKGFGGMIPGALMIEYAALERLTHNG